jgi:DNA-binding FrmR family transcriptional regulator
MTIKMRLDTDGLRALIKDNPELEIEIGREVLENIQRDNIKERVQGQINACLKSMVHTGGNSWNPQYTATSPEMVKAVQAAAQHVIGGVLKEHLDGAIQERVNAMMRVEREMLFKNVKELLKDLVAPEMAKEILREKILL